MFFVVLRNCQNSPTITLMFYFLERAASKGRLYNFLNILGHAPSSGNKKVVDRNSTLDFLQISLYSASVVFLSGRENLGKIKNRIYKYLHIQNKTWGSGSRIFFKMAAVSWKVLYIWNLGLCCLIPGWFKKEKILLETLIPSLSYDAHKRSKKMEQTQV